MARAKSSAAALNGGAVGCRSRFAAALTAYSERTGLTAGGLLPMADAAKLASAVAVRKTA
jgi:hypothetical protein